MRPAAWENEMRYFAMDLVSGEADGFAAVAVERRAAESMAPSSSGSRPPAAVMP